MLKSVNTAVKESDLPFYAPNGSECEIFEHAYHNRLPVLLKGPTGCGKTRFVAHMAARLGRPLYTVSCHDDLTAADLTGRYLLKGGDTVWVGAICYLDEVVEARKDVTVVLHPVTDDRRTLPLERTGELLQAPPEFMLVASYNPGYQNVLKTLKPSTRQRFLAMEFGFPTLDTEAGIVAHESGLPHERCLALVRVAQALRGLKGQDIEEGASTRLIVYCATMIRDGVDYDTALRVALIEPLSDDPEIVAGLIRVAQIALG